MMCPDINLPEKHKNNDYQQYAKDLKNVDGRPDRGGCLSAFLALNIFANGLILIIVIGAFFAIRTSGEYVFDSGTEALVYAGFVILVARFISAIGLWNWKQWGYYGIMAGFAISIAIGLLSGDDMEITRSVVWGVIVYFMVRPIRDYLE